MVTFQKDLSELEIKLLLKINNNALSKKAFSQIFKRISKPARIYALQSLVAENFLLVRKVPKPHAKKTPTYFFITDIGKKWIEEYLDSLPL